MDGGALAIQNGVINGVENRCDLTAPVSIGNGTQFTAVCMAEGSTYNEPIAIAPTTAGVSIERGGYAYDWDRCEARQVTASASQSTINSWVYLNRSAVISAGSDSFALSCDLFNASSTYATASLMAPCPLCFPRETKSYTLRVDGGYAEEFEFERVSNAEGSMSDLGYQPEWYVGLIPALMAGSLLEVIEQGNVIAIFSLSGSNKAIGALRTDCN